jgi:hypothetical protein
MMPTLIKTGLVFILAWATTIEPTVQAFVTTPHTFGLARTRTELGMLPQTLLTSQQLPSAVSLTQPSLLVADAMEIVQNVLIGVGGIVVVLFGVTILLSSWVIPKAAEQIELQAKELDPALWQEYASRLEPGEVLAMRPDLMQELGKKVQALTMEKFEKMQEEARNPTVIRTETMSSMSDGSNTASSRPPQSNVVDVEVTSKKWDD